MLYYKVAGHALALAFSDAGTDEGLIPSFAPFRMAEEPEALLFTMTVDDGQSPSGSDWQEAGREVGLFDCGGCNHGVFLMPDGGYRFEIHDAQDVLCCRMQSNADFSLCRASIYGSTWAQRNYGLNNALMMAFAFAAATHGTLLMHASVIRCEGRGYLMTAPSGTGKSTHTRLWYDNIPGCDLMNDDNPVVRTIGDEAIVYGSPWSGKTRCYRNIEAPIGGIVRIQQRPENSIRPLQVMEAYCNLLTAVSSMKWDKRVADGINDTLSSLIRLTPIYELGCLPNAEAAFLCHDTLTR